MTKRNKIPLCLCLAPGCSHSRIQRMLYEHEHFRNESPRVAGLRTFISPPNADNSNDKNYQRYCESNQADDDDRHVCNKKLNPLVFISKVTCFFRNRMWFWHVSLSATKNPQGYKVPGEMDKSPSRNPVTLIEPSENRKQGYFMKVIA